MPHDHPPRKHVLHETNYRDIKAFAPNVAVLPWGATEAHNYHLPYGTDVIEATCLGEASVAAANEQGAKCILLPTIPFGIDHSQLYQVATITMRASTQQLVLFDVAESLVRQGINRLVLLNFHGGNDFKSMIRDVMLDLPIFIAQIHGFRVNPKIKEVMTHTDGDHACEMETSMLMHLEPNWVLPLSEAHDGSVTPSKLPQFSANPGAWTVRDWASLTTSSGVGNPHASTAEKGKKIFELLVEKLSPMLVEISNAKDGDFPLVIPKGR